ncbi:MAG: PEP-CTERM sorting domain-containing protein [Cyanophyceae cyanobacterium]
MKPLSTLPVVFAGASLMVSAIALEATSTTLDFSRTVGNPNSNSVASAIKISNANNIYVVDGINNVLEVLDSSVWFTSALNQTGIDASKKTNVYFVDGINNTLQVLDDTTIGVLAATDGQDSFAPARGNAFLVDDFNQSIAVGDPNNTGLIATNGSRNGLLTLPANAANSPDDTYIVDGFNNRLEITNRKGVPRANPLVPVAYSNFFAGETSIEEIRDELGALIANVSSSESGSFEEAFSDIADGPFDSASDEELEADIINNVGNPNRNLGWVKNLSVNEPVNAAGSNLSLQRGAYSGGTAINSQIDITSEQLGVHLIDGFNNALQVIKTSEIADKESVYLVDGINNSLQISDTSLSLFGSNSNSERQVNGDAAAMGGGVDSADVLSPEFVRYLANDASNPEANGWLEFLSPEVLDTVLAEFGSGDDIDGNFLYFLANYASGNIPDSIPPQVGLGQSFTVGGEFNIEEVFADLGVDSDGQIVFADEIVGNRDEDYYQAEKIANRIELVDSNGEIYTIADDQVAVDGSGNVYLARGINNRIRIAGDNLGQEAATVPEPSSILGLLLLGGGAVAARRHRQ